MKKNYVGSLLLLACFVVSCASSNSTRERAATYRTSIGTGTELDIQRQTPVLLTRYGYEMNRQEGSSDGLYFETSWRERSLFEDEEAMGIKQARTRIIITTRPRGSGTASAALHTITFVAENEVILAEEDGWTNSVMTDMTEQYLRGISREYSTEMSTGVRRF